MASCSCFFAYFLLLLPLLLLGDCDAASCDAAITRNWVLFSSFAYFLAASHSENGSKIYLDVLLVRRSLA